MTQFQLFDNVKLTENISLSDGDIAPQETKGIIVEVKNFLLYSIFHIIFEDF